MIDLMSLWPNNEIRSPNVCRGLIAAEPWPTDSRERRRAYHGPHPFPWCCSAGRRAVGMKLVVCVCEYVYALRVVYCYCCDDEPVCLFLYLHDIIVYKVWGYLFVRFSICKHKIQCADIVFGNSAKKRCWYHYNIDVIHKTKMFDIIGPIIMASLRAWPACWCSYVHVRIHLHSNRIRKI